MKKTFILSFVAVASLFAASNSEILKLYSSLPANFKTTIEKREAVKGLSGVDMVQVRITDGKRSESNIFFTKGDYIIPDLIDIKTHSSLKSQYEQAETNKNIAALFKKQNQNDVVKIGNDPKKPTLVVFTDPDCPFCRAELSKAKEILKDSNIEYIFAPVHGENAFKKASLILKHLSEAKTDEEKLALMDKYYNPSYKIDEKIDPVKLQIVKETTQKYQEAGVRSVPYVVPASELK